MLERLAELSALTAETPSTLEIERGPKMAWIIDAEVNFEGQQSSNNFEIEADTAEEALQQAKERLERNGATVLKIEAKMLQ